MFNNQRVTLILISLVFSMVATISAQAQPKYSFGYQTNPGEVRVYTGEVTTAVKVPWAEMPDDAQSTMYYRSTLTTKSACEGDLTRLEETEVILANGERINDQVTYRILAPDFAYIDAPGGILTGIDFFPPIPVSVGSSWTITAELAIPYLNAMVPLTTTYYLQEIVPVGEDEVAIIRQYTELEQGTVNYLQVEMEMGLEAWGTLFWSLGSGDYIGRYVANKIVLQLPPAMGNGEMVTTVSRSEVIESGNAVSAPIEEYIRLYLGKQLN